MPSKPKKRKGFTRASVDGEEHLKAIRPVKSPEEERKTKKELTIIEKKFLLCVQRGDVIEVRKLLEKHKGSHRLDINCLDPLGRTSLVVAIENESMELIELLLSFGCDPGDSLLHAISEQYVEAVEVLLQHEEKIHEMGKPYSWEAIESKSATYTRDITPLILAAHRDNYEILKLLLDRGACLPAPHDVRCACDVCVQETKEDCLRHSKSRINAYRALSSPSLISLSSKDPVLTAFELSKEVRRLSSIENEFKTEYQELEVKLQTFATSLLNHTRTTHELTVLLNFENPGVTFDSSDRMKLERLKLAIEYEQKSFVAHSSVQQLLASVWYEGMPGFKRKGPIGQMGEIAKLGAMFPVYCTAYIFAPNSTTGRKMKQPFIKFICHSSAYSFFLLLLVMNSQRAETLAIEWFGPTVLQEWYAEYQRKERGKFPLVVESFIIIFIAGYVWEEVKELWDNGIGAYAEDMWNVLDVISNFFYISWVGLRIVSFYCVQREIAAGYDAYPPRDQWHPYDPMLISEGMFGAATIFSILKLVNIFSVNPHLGPLQISLGRMVFDIIKFFFIYTLVVFAFGCGMNQLLWYYAENDKNECYDMGNDLPNPDKERNCEVWRRFSNLFETSQSLFWASFGLIELYNFELVGIKGYTRFWAMLMFGCYSIINVVVLLNLLIAMMSNSYNFISEKADTEWKFARSKLWMNYFEDGGTVPPPFNICPSAKMVKNLFGCKSKPPSRSLKLKQNLNKALEYEAIMRNLVRRYVTFQQREQEDNPVTEDDVNEVKQDIATFRVELFDILKTNGMNCAKVNMDKETGKKEREFQRRLLKGFNIGLVQTVIGAALRHNSSKRAFNEMRKMTGKKFHAQKNWNAMVQATRSHQNHIGSSDHPNNLRGSLTELRNRVLNEKENDDGTLKRPPGLHGAKLMAAIAKNARIQARRERIIEYHDNYVINQNLHPDLHEEDEADRVETLKKPNTVLKWKKPEPVGQTNLGFVPDEDTNQPATSGQSAFKSKLLRASKKGSGGMEDQLIPDEDRQKAVIRESDNKKVPDMKRPLRISDSKGITAKDSAAKDPTAKDPERPPRGVVQDRAYLERKLFEEGMEKRKKEEEEERKKKLLAERLRRDEEMGKMSGSSVIIDMGRRNMLEEETERRKREEEMRRKKVEESAKQSALCLPKSKDISGSYLGRDPSPKGGISMGRDLSPGGKPSMGRDLSPGGKPSMGRDLSPGGRSSVGRDLSPGEKPFMGKEFSPRGGEKDGPSVERGRPTSGRIIGLKPVIREPGMDESPMGRGGKTDDKMPGGKISSIPKSIDQDQSHITDKRKMDEGMPKGIMVDKEVLKKRKSEEKVRRMSLVLQEDEQEAPPPTPSPDYNTLSPTRDDEPAKKKVTIKDDKPSKSPLPSPKPPQRGGPWL